MSIVVRSKKELECAIERKEKDIVIVGELAEDVKRTERVKTLGPIALGTLGTALAAIPFSGGLSTFGVIPIAISIGLSPAIIILIITIGLTLILTLIKDYDEVTFRAKGAACEAELHLRRKS